ncbi:MAG: 4Fe-4S binding protein [Anaerolineales bacterium]|nr:4Fe-4S binding protein [Anaerolineales bacterium]
MKPNEVDLSIEFLGMRLPNPLALTEGPLTGSADRIRRAATYPIGLLVTKGIRPAPAVSPNPFIAKSGRSSLMNADWSDIGFEQWLLDLDSLKDRDFFLVASIAKNYVTPQEAADMAKEISKRQPDVVTLVDYDAQDLIRAVRLTRPRVKQPLMVKLCPFMPRLEEVLKDLIKAGIDAVAVMDSIGPVMSIDVETGLPSMGSADGSGYLSGEAIKPVTVKYVYDISSYIDLPVLGVGGVSSGKDVVEMTMAGATVVGMCAAPLLRGLEEFQKVENQLKKYLAGRELASINNVRKLTHRLVSQAETTTTEKAFIIDEKCENCGTCVKVCFKRAPIQKDDRTWVQVEKCVGCGLCVSVCPTNAIRLIKS